MNLIESWDNFSRYYGGVVGARDCFELACEEFLRLENPQKEVHRIKASRGDGGIDIYISDGENVDIYQCKFFMDTLNSSRWFQIKCSLDRVLELDELSISSWTLCMPKEFTKEDIFEIEKFKKRYSTIRFGIHFVDGNEIISRMKNVGISDKWFSPVEKRVLSSNVPKVIPEYIERNEIAELIELIKDSDTHLMITGIGGIGKTTLLEKLYDMLKNAYDTCTWIDYKNDFLTSFATSMLEENLSDQILLARLKEYFNYKANQRNIIFIDNVDEKYLFDKHRLFFEKNAILVVTSRLECIAGYREYELNSFNDEKILDLFSSYYKQPMSQSERLTVLELIKCFDKNTLLVELIARAAQKSVMGLDEFVKKIKDKGVVSTGIKVQNYRGKTYSSISRHLSSLYILEGMEYEKKRILVNFTLTKDTGVTNSFIKILKATEDDIGELIEFGWLKKKNKKLYMHPIIKECVKEQIDTYQPYIIEIMHAYSNREFYKDEYSIFEKSMHFDVMLNILTMIDFCEINNIYVLYNLIEMIKTFRCYESLDNVVGLAVQELEKHEESVEKAKIGADIFNVAGLAYLAYDNNKAMVCFACEEQLIEKYFHDKMRLKAICKGNFALAYIGIDFDIAKEKFKEALEMQIECFGEDSTEVADCYHNIGKNYFENNDYSTAIEYFKLSLKIKREKCRDTYTLLKTELALANAMNFNMNEPYQRSEIETIRELYIAVLEKYSLLQNVIDVEWMYTLHIMADFLNKIGEKESSKRLEELITERRDMS